MKHIKSNFKKLAALAVAAAITLVSVPFAYSVTAQGTGAGAQYKLTDDEFFKAVYAICCTDAKNISYGTQAGELTKYGLSGNSWACATFVAYFFNRVVAQLDTGSSDTIGSYNLSFGRMIDGTVKNQDGSEYTGIGTWGEYDYLRSGTLVDGMQSAGLDFGLMRPSDYGASADAPYNGADSIAQAYGLRRGSIVAYGDKYSSEWSSCTVDGETYYANHTAVFLGHLTQTEWNMLMSTGVRTYLNGSYSADKYYVIEVIGDDSSGRALSISEFRTYHASSGADCPLFGCYNPPETEKNGLLTMKKSSSNTSVTDGNDCYSFEGIEYTVYSDADGAAAMGKFVLAADGSVASVTALSQEAGTEGTSLKLPQGTYYIKENEDTGTGNYITDGELHEVKLDSDPYTFNAADEPAADPVKVEIDKTGNTQDQTGIPSLSGTQFTIKYYDGQYETAEAAEASGAASRTWVIETKWYEKENKYAAYLDSDCLVSGDALYLNADGDVIVPVGTLIIEETKAADGYTAEGSWLLSGGGTVSGDGEKLIVNVTAESAGVVANGKNTYTREDAPEMGGLLIMKQDSLAEDSPQGDATLEGVTFAVINDTGHAVKVNGAEYADGAQIMTVSSMYVTAYTYTDAASGTARTIENAYIATTDTDLDGTDRSLPVGNYIVKELAASDGYNTGGQTFSLSILEDGAIADTDTGGNAIVFENDVIRNGVQILKRAKTYEGTAYNGLRPEVDVYEQRLTSEDDDPDYYDYMSYTDPAYEGTDFSGVVFEIINVSTESECDTSVWIPEESVSDIALSDEYTATYVCDGVTYYEYAYGSVIGTITTDAAGLAETSDNALPYGTYYIQEEGTDSGDGYYLANSFYLYTGEENEDRRIAGSHGFEVREDGSVAEKVDTGLNGCRIVWADEVIRVDFSFKKHFESTNRLAHTAWVLTNLDSGEQHIIVTDENGIYDSSDYPLHGTDTNANDALLEYVNSDGTIKSSYGSTYIDIDEFKETGLWFGLLSDGTTAEVGGKGNDYGALVYGHYLLQEIATDTNQGSSLMRTTFTVDRNGYSYDETYTAREPYEIDLGTFTDYVFSTEALIDDESSHMLSESATLKDILVTDVLSYEGLQTGTYYKVEGGLYDIETGEMVAEVVNGDWVCAQAADEFIVETDWVVGSLEGRAGHTLSFRLTVYEEGEDGTWNQIARLEDDTEEDEAILIPAIETQAFDVNGEKDVSALDGEVTVTDTVKITNFVYGASKSSYTVTGYLVDAETGERVSEKKQASVTVTKGLRAKNNTYGYSYYAEGEANVTFEVDASDLAGHTLVAFETLERNITFLGFNVGSAVAAEHKDTEDEAQKIYIPALETELLDSAGGTHTGTVDPESDTLTLTDTVTVSNVLGGKEYTVEGIIVDAETGKEIQAVANGPTTLGENNGDDATVTMTFTVENASEYSGHRLVAYEYLYRQRGNGYGGESDQNSAAGASVANKLMASHEDIEDENQSVTLPYNPEETTPEETTPEETTPEETTPEETTPEETTPEETTPEETTSEETTPEETTPDETTFEETTPEETGTEEQSCEEPVTEQTTSGSSETTPPAAAKAAAADTGDFPYGYVWGGITALALLLAAGCIVSWRKEKKSKSEAK